MTPQQFIDKWQASKLSERSACHEHFLDLCKLLGQPTPAESDPDGAWYTFERGVHKLEGEQGWADVWMENHFAWEYKGKHKDLTAAYKQLLQYREDLGNPPLLVVCDMNRFEVHTNFTRTAKKVYAFDLAGLAEPANLDVLRKAFTAPDELRPGQTAEAVTEQASEIIGQIADGMRVRNIDAHRAAHFLMKIMFSMFAEDIVLLKNKPLKQIFESAAKPGVANAADKLSKLLKNLFEAMAAGGTFGADDVLHFNGGLFADADVIDLRVDEIQKLAVVNTLDWSNVEPSVFGTLFERILDPAKRSQIGAHYTSRDDILLLLEPVMMQPLRREWAEVKGKCESLVPKIQEEARKRKKAALSKAKAPKPVRDFNKLIEDFHDRLTKVTVLDPACGSGNFLYVALKLLLDLEKEVITYASRYVPGMFPEVRPTQLAGIEINEYAQELASVVIWIGYLQWMHHNGFNPPSNPVLEPIESIRRMDAILDFRSADEIYEPIWPTAEFVIGNPPFLGDKRMRNRLGKDYTETLRAKYKGRLPGRSDLCCYWFEKAREMVVAKRCSRAGLLATQAIRGGGNRAVLEHIKESGDIFFAVSDRDWILDGATVHVSLIGFDSGSETLKVLDGECVATINANLTSFIDITKSKQLKANKNAGFMGCTPSGPFEMPDDEALRFLSMPNPHGRPNSDVLRPWLIGDDITDRYRFEWVIDMSHLAAEHQAASYELPYRRVSELVTEARQKYTTGGDSIWRFERPRPKMRKAMLGLDRFLATSMVSKHVFFQWLPVIHLPANLVIAFASGEDFLLGLLHSRVHTLWAIEMGTQLRDAASGGRYTHTTCFETFPYPETSDAQHTAIAEAARELDQLRTNWLNPPEWTTTQTLEFPGTVGGPWDRYIDPATVRPINSSAPLSPPGRGAGGEGGEAGTRRNHPSPTLPLKGREPEEVIRIGTVKYPRTIPRDEASAKELKKRTLTNLYNQRPAWLDLAHKKLDEAVFAAYGWPADISDDDLLAKLLELNLERAAAEAR
jgi:hypothetical protein